MRNIQAIQSVLERMAELLRAAGRDDWTRSLEAFRSELVQDPGETTAKIASVFGGMGSLNDLILYKDKKVLVDENEEFDRLRSRLFELCHG